MSFNIQNLEPYDNQKSFYGKAKVITTDYGWKLLKSYNTIVAGVSPKGNVERYFMTKSRTTSKHIKSFLRYCYGKDLDVKWFYSIPLSENRYTEFEEEI